MGFGVFWGFLVAVTFLNEILALAGLPSFRVVTCIFESIQDPLNLAGTLAFVTALSGGAVVSRRWLATHRTDDAEIERAREAEARVNLGLSLTLTIAGLLLFALFVLADRSRFPANRASDDSLTFVAIAAVFFLVPFRIATTTLACATPSARRCEVLASATLALYGFAVACATAQLAGDPGHAAAVLVLGGGLAALAWRTLGSMRAATRPEEGSKARWPLDVAFRSVVFVTLALAVAPFVATLAHDLLAPGVKVF